MSRLKLSLIVFALAGFVALGLGHLGSSAQSPPATAAGETAAPAPSCTPFPVPTAPFVDAQLSPCIPYAVSASDFASVSRAQPAFDVFSWRSFVALNWPTDGKTIGQDGDNPTVWETYNESYQVFLADGSAPHWGAPVDVPAACKGANLPVFRMKQKVSDEVLDERGQPFRTGPLIDGRGDYVRYAIHLNRETFDYVLDNGLYNKEGQAKFASDPANVVDLPAGTNGSTKTSPVAPPAIGSIVIKSAWRLLDPTKDKLERYHKSNVLVYTAPSDDPPIKERCEARTVGLVGFHIMHKTAPHPQWIWSTFEQVDNLRGNKAAGVSATFFNAAFPRRKINRPPPMPWNPNVKAPPSQIVRDIPIDQGAQALNKQWQGLLGKANPKSVWQFYQLISTQWPTKALVPDPKDPTKKVLNGFGAPAPATLGNAMLETYTQRSSSCIECHKNATTTGGKFGDFSYLLQRAQPEKKP